MTIRAMRGLIPIFILLGVAVNSENRGLHHQPALIRIGIAPGTWVGVNRNDASAAIKAWAKTIVQQRDIFVEVEIRMYETAEAICQAIGRHEIDAVTMLADQFIALDPALQPDTIFVSTKSRAFTKQYVLLVHQGSNISDVNGLPGTRLLLQVSARTNLARQWLDTLLARRSLGRAGDILKAITEVTSPSKAILQVFFRQAEVCLVTANVFDLACELNPQLRKQLRALAVSEPVVPSLFFFRKDWQLKERSQLEAAILTLSETPAGQQVLTVFQGDGMVKRPLSCLASTRALLVEYAGLKRQPDAGKEVTTPPPHIRP